MTTMAAPASFDTAMMDVKSMQGTLMTKKLNPSQDLAKIRESAQDFEAMFLTEMLARGILIAASHNLCCSHTPTDLAQIRKAWD